MVAERSRKNSLVIRHPKVAATVAITLIALSSAFAMRATLEKADISSITIADITTYGIGGDEMLKKTFAAISPRSEFYVDCIQGGGRLLCEAGASIQEGDAYTRARWTFGLLGKEDGEAWPTVLAFAINGEGIVTWDDPDGWQTHRQYFGPPKNWDR